MVGGAQLYVSWNGATDVAAWRLRTGSSADALDDGATTPRSGFETALALPPGAAYAAAIALDAGGQPLRTSNVVRLS